MSETHLTGAEDPTGRITLERFSAAPHFNKWLYETIRPYCKGHVLEVGSGIGNITQLLIESSFRVTASDLRNEYLELLAGKFQSSPKFETTLQLDLETEHIPASLENRFDTIVALNVIEHIFHADKAIENCYRMLKTGGNLVVLVPAMQWLYNSFDKELGHHLRYSSAQLRALLESQQLKVIHTQFFNAMGIAGWWMNGSVLKKKLIPAGQLKLYDRLVPAIKLADMIVMHSIGLSVIAVGTKQ
jgi:2-polyprenyl-3-methyl-5-hydroxy-6-metoxy-1,4-benzoquinol methylase